MIKLLWLIWVLGISGCSRELPKDAVVEIEDIVDTVKDAETLKKDL